MGKAPGVGAPGKDRDVVSEDVVEDFPSLASDSIWSVNSLVVTVSASSSATLPSRDG